MTFPDHTTQLREMAASLGDPAVLTLTDRALQLPGFTTCSGSVKAEHHHYGTGGLQQHTWEVCTLCLQNETFFASLEEGVHSRRVLFLAALYHDLGKRFDYAESDICPGDWYGTPHKRLIHHITRSALIWEQATQATGCGSGWSDEVFHAILAHHGRREWGSPVAPKTRIAWMLHLCDQMSARMDDCVRHDPYE